MADLDSIIGAAVAEAAGGGDDAAGDSTSSETPRSADVDTGMAAVAADETASGAAATSADAAAPAVVEPATDDLTKELADLGLKPPEDGQRENRLPYSRVKKIVENSRTKLTAGFTTQLAERDAKVTAAEAKVANMAAIDNLISTDPDRYIGMLAALHPDKYKKFLDTGFTGKPAPPPVSPPVVLTTPRPTPDLKYEDGSLGYSPQQHEKLLDWIAADAENKAYARDDAEMTKRFGPLEQKYKIEQTNAALMPGVQAQLEWGKQTWGKLFEDDYKLDSKSEVLAYMRTHKGIPFEAVLSAVLLPKVQADRTRMRAEILTEINARPRAAARSTPAATTTTPAVTGARDPEDVIRDAISAAGLK